MTTAAASVNNELGPTTPAAGDGTEQEDSIEQETALVPSSETPTAAKEVKPGLFFSRFFGNAGKCTFRNLEFLEYFGLEFCKES